VSGRMPNFAAVAANIVIKEVNERS